MSVALPAFHVLRQSVVGHENEYAKMFDPRPVGASPALPEPLTPNNPVPEVMEAQGFSQVSTPHTFSCDLLNGVTLRTWDNLKNLTFFTFRDKDLKSPFNGGNYPATTIRVPREVVFHGSTNGKGPPPHTIHWHGIEPTPINDGVGHCSMEIGNYTYQWQPNFIGTYFYHCHRNTMQHFEFGLFGLLLIMPPDAYWSSILSTNPDGTVNLNPTVPVGACSDGKFRTAANAPAFPGFVAGDPITGVGDSNPWSFTVPYDVEALWVLDDRDSLWSDLASDAFATFPQAGSVPGSNDQFFNRPGSAGFFNFNDFKADYWFVTGVPVPAHQGGTGTVNPVAAFGGDGTIPAPLNSGVAGSQVAVNAKVGQTILVRCLDAAYNSAVVRFPVDVTIIAWDGRALGVPPFGRYNQAYTVTANTPIQVSTARRFDALIRPLAPINSFAAVVFQETRGGERTLTARIPFKVTP
ncbi:MAG: multicopper oxidase domain-containing protein [Syntrophobacteraceae bacterium]